MTAEEAVRYLEEKYADEPTVLDTEDALEAIGEALALAYKALKMAEWAKENGYHLVTLWEHEIKEQGAQALVIERVKPLLVEGERE